MRAALREYYPTALQAFDDWTLRGAWAFVERLCTPQALVAAGKRRWEKFLHAHKLYHSQETYARRLTRFAAPEQFCGTAAVTNAKNLLARSLAIPLRVLEDHLDEYRQRIGERFGQHPDHDLFGSLPGVGPKLAPRLLSALGDQRTRFESHESLQCHAGTAPVTRQSGRSRKTRIRRACQTTLRATVHLWANLRSGRISAARPARGPRPTIARNAPRARAMLALYAVWVNAG